MELAASLAADDPDPDVVVAVVESLAFRGADRQVNRIMRIAPEAVWKALGRESYPDHLSDPQLDLRLAAERAASRAIESPVQLLQRIADDKPADAENRIAVLLGNAEIEFKDVYIEHAISGVYSEFPGSVAAGLVTRIAADLSLPHRARDYLNGAPLVDSGPLAKAALDPTTPQLRLNAAAAVIGPMTVSTLLDQLFAIYERMQALGRSDEQLSNAYWRLVNAISATRQDVFVPALIARAQTEDPLRIGLLADLLARHSGNSWDPKPPIQPALRAPLCITLDLWITTLLAAPQTVRHASSEVARGAERVAVASLAEPLRLLLERDLTDYAAARAAYLARPQGPIPPDACTGYSNLYAHAFAAMHDAPAVAVLTRDLSDLRWGVEAAGALHQIWAADHPPAEKPRIGSWTDFSQHIALRAERAAGTPPTSEFAEAIFSVVRTLGASVNSDAVQQHALALAVTGLALPHGNKRREIDVLLALPQPITDKYGLLRAAARAGEVIPASLLLDGPRNLLVVARTQTWRLDASRGELMGWIELFPFSDDPEKVHDALVLLSEPYRQPHALHRLLESLPQSPARLAHASLERLAADNPAFLQEFEWMNALIKLDTEAAAVTLLDRLCSGHIPVGDGFRWSGGLTAWARRYQTVRTAIIARYRALPTGNIRRVLEMAMDDLADEEVFMALFDGHVDTPYPNHGLAHAIRNLAIGKKPSEEWAGAFEEFGLPLTGVRGRLSSTPCQTMPHCD
jgi:hypothetical protein